VFLFDFRQLKKVRWNDLHKSRIFKEKSI